jgi:hypothetical protein
MAGASSDSTDEDNPLMAGPEQGQTLAIFPGVIVVTFSAVVVSVPIRPRRWPSQRWVGYPSCLVCIRDDKGPRSFLAFPPRIGSTSSGGMRKR